MIEVYDQCISNPQILQHGDKYLTEYLIGYPNFAMLSLEVILDPSHDAQQRKYIGTCRID